MTESRSIQQQALADALQNARMHLAEEIAAVALCEQHGWTFDGVVARREVTLYTALIARLEARAAEVGR